jgi:hypothetical protein
MPQYYLSNEYVIIQIASELTEYKAIHALVENMYNEIEKTEFFGIALSAEHGSKALLNRFRTHVDSYESGKKCVGNARRNLPDQNCSCFLYF